MHETKRKRREGRKIEEKVVFYYLWYCSRKYPLLPTPLIALINTLHFSFLLCYKMNKSFDQYGTKKGCEFWNSQGWKSRRVSGEWEQKCDIEEHLRSEKSIVQISAGVDVKQCTFLYRCFPNYTKRWHTGPIPWVCFYTDLFWN